MIKPITAAAIGAASGTVGLAVAKNISKNGKTIGLIGSPAHILTNDKIEDKSSALKELNKESLKDSAKLLGATAGVASGAALVTGISKKAQNYVGKVISNTGNALNKVYNQSGETLKSHLKENSKLIKKFLNATPATKAAALAGAAFLAIATPIAMLSSASKAGYIEAKYETKNQAE